MSYGIKILGAAYSILKTFERDNLVAPENGLVIFNGDVPGLQLNIGTPASPVWINIGVGDGNTVDFAGVAWVATDGNNFTGVAGDANKSFATINNALDVADIVIVKPGSYSQSITVNSARPNKTIISMDGVVYTSGGLYVYNGTSSVRFIGRSVIDGNFHDCLQVNTTEAVDIEFECAAIKRSRSVCFTPSGSPAATIRFKADYVSCNGVNGGGYAVRMYGTVDAVFNIATYGECSYTMYHCRTGFAGKLVVNCPETRVVAPLNGNPYGETNKHALWIDAILDAEIVFNGDLVDKHTTNRLGGVFNATNLTNGVTFPKVTINGDIKSVGTMGLYFWYRSAYGLFVFNGDIINTNNAGTGESVPIWTQLTGWAGAADQTLIFKGNIQAFHRSVLGSGKKFHFYSPFIYNADVAAAGGLFFKSDTGGGQQSKIYFYNSKMELGNAPGTSEILLGDASLASDIVGSVDVKGTEPSLTTAVADIWTGYAQLAGLVTPKV